MSCSTKSKFAELSLVLDLFLQDMMKMLLSEKSENARGTLHHIVSLFHFKMFNNTARDYFLNLWDFITVRRRSVPQSVISHTPLT